MLKITKPSANRIDIDLRGVLDTDSMRKGLDDLIAASDGVTGGRMLYKISEFALPTLGAIGVELARLPGLFGLLSKFDKCAVLCDTPWMRQAANIEGALFPGIDIKSFEFNQAERAEAWLEEDEEDDEAEDFPV